MKVVLFCHSLVSDWNHGNAHFLRGICLELQARGHEVAVHEPRDGWSRANLLRDEGDAALRAFETAFPTLSSNAYDPCDLDLDRALDAADLVLVHEWNDPQLVAAVGAHRSRAGRYTLLFHDTHHRAATAPGELERFDLGGYDGVLAFGEAVRAIYERRGWGRRAWTWHEAADVRTFTPLDRSPEADLVWIGNLGDGERGEELARFLLEPARRAGLSGTLHGVRYPPARVAQAEAAGLRYGGYLPNHRAPEAFARHRITVHVPRRPYARALPGIPTIRVFEALASGIPLVCAPWDDAEGLFRPGSDYLVARDGDEMERHMRALAADPQLARSLRESGLETVLSRHTCAHRVDDLLRIAAGLREATEVPA